MNKQTWQEKVRLVEKDDTASYWLKQAVKDLLLRDPLDAANEAEFLAQLMREREFETMESASKLRYKL